MTIYNNNNKPVNYSRGPLPHDLELERIILGRIIMPYEDDEKIEQLALTAEPNDFYLDKHKQIYVAMLELYEEQIEIDLITLREKLEKLGTLEDIGGSPYLTYLVEVANI